MSKKKKKKAGQEEDNLNLNFKFDVSTLKNDKTVCFRVPSVIYDCVMKYKQKKGVSISKIFRSLLIKACNSIKYDN